MRQQFTQKERDVETGLDYFGARYHGSSLGRFTGADPYDVNIERQSTADPDEGNRLGSLFCLVVQGFTVIDGTIVSTATRQIAENIRAENFPDVTGFECFVNHIHVGDQLHGYDQLALLRQGVAFGLAVRKQLRSAFPDKAFKVIIAATAHSCGVRFHLVRPGEEWLASDLDGYKDEAILVLETGSAA